MGTYRFAVAGLVTMTIALAAAHAVASAQGTKGAAPRTPWGDPDLQGTYTSDNWIGVPFARPQQFGTRAELTQEEFEAREKANAEQVARDENVLPESQQVGKDDAPNNAPRHWLERPERPSRATSIVIDPPDGRLPPTTPEAQRSAADRQAARKTRGRGGPASYTDFSNYDRCITRGVIGSILPAIYGNGTTIHQGPGVVVIRNEMIHEARVIPLDTRPRPGSDVQMYMGAPRGRWEGDTLVVESTNFTDRTSVGNATHSDELRLEERFTRVDADTIRYEFTVNDPKTYTRPWTARIELDSRPGFEIYEYACHEGNYGLRNMLLAARASEREGR